MAWLWNFHYGLSACVWRTKNKNKHVQEMLKGIMALLKNLILHSSWMKFWNFAHLFLISLRVPKSCPDATFQWSPRSPAAVVVDTGNDDFFSMDLSSAWSWATFWLLQSTSHYSRQSHVWAVWHQCSTGNYKTQHHAVAPVLIIRWDPCRTTAAQPWWGFWGCEHSLSWDKSTMLLLHTALKNPRRKQKRSDCEPSCC